jgi:hypothetical protein
LCNAKKDCKAEFIAMRGAVSRLIQSVAALVAELERIASNSDGSAA